MSKFSDDEQGAWDVYFAAALPLAKAEGLATGTNIDGSWAEVIKQEGSIADNMIEERRVRKPSPQGGFF